MIGRLFNILFGCRHRNTALPITMLGGQHCKPYVVCLDCGAEFSFNVEKSCRGERIDRAYLRDVGTATHSQRND
jgi:hypothetical protein